MAPGGGGAGWGKCTESIRSRNEGPRRPAGARRQKRVHLPCTKTVLDGKTRPHSAARTGTGECSPMTPSRRLQVLTTHWVWKGTANAHGRQETRSNDGRNPPGSTRKAAQTWRHPRGALMTSPGGCGQARLLTSPGSACGGGDPNRRAKDLAACCPSAL